MEMACCIGTGRPSFGHATKQAKVLYLIAEGVPGFSERIQSWEQYNGVSTKGLVTFLPVPIQFMKRRGRCRFAMLLNHYRYDLTFFDTQARVTVGMKENDTTDMGIFVDKLGALRQLRRMPHLGAHEPRFGEHLRGSISMEGAAVSVFRTFKEGTQVTFETTKQKDIEEPDPFDPQLFKTHTSAVLTLMQPGEQALTQPQMHILQTLQDAAAEWVSKTENSVTSGIPYTTYSKNINELINRGYVDQTKGKNKFLRYIPEKERRV